MISGVFSTARQAIRLNYLPRLRIVHTSSATEGQIYIPFINWTVFLAVIALIMVALYDSYIYPFVVLFSIPVAMIGARSRIARKMLP